MKKALLIILLLLPIILVVVVAVAGYFAAELGPRTPVESIEFVDKRGNPYTSEIEFKVEQKGKPKQVFVRVLPEAANNKAYTLTSSDPDICSVYTVVEDGLEKIYIQGNHWGNTTITAKTKEDNKIAILNVRVTADKPFEVKLSHKEVELIEKSTFQLSADVDAPVALDKNVIYTSSDDGIVKVDANGKLTAVKEGTATITATTVSGGLTDTCVVTVEKGILPISLDFSNLDVEVFETGCISKLATLNLRECLRVREDVNVNDVKIVIKSGSSATISDDGVLTFTEFNKVITLYAYVGDINTPTHSYELRMIYRPNV